jgi:exodeoxyribonuclease-3
VRLPQLLAWLGSAKPDVLCLQELKCATDAFPYDEVRELGYETEAHGTGRWNGVAILSKVGFEDVVRDLPDQPGFQADDSMIEVKEPRAIAATCGPIRVWSVYVPNGREVEHAHYFYKLKWLDALRAASVDDAAGDRPYAVLGDFNIAPTDADLWDPSAYVGQTHVTAPEREALAAVQGAGLQDVMPRPLKYDQPFSYWDYRQLAFPKNRGMRIDLVLANKPFATAVSDAYVDREARKGKSPSDHAPVVVDLDL